MKILLVSHEYPPDTDKGGISTYTKNLAYALTKKGEQVIVLTYSHKKFSIYSENGIKIIRLHFPLIYKLYPLLICPIIYYIVKKEKIDIIESPEYCAEVSIYQIFRTVPVVTRIHAPSFYIRMLDNRKASFFNKILDKFEYLQIIHSDRISIISNHLLKAIRQVWDLSKLKPIVIPNGINKPSLLKTTNNKYGSDYLLYFGKLKENKGVLVFSYAVKKLLKKYPNQKILFLGQDTKKGDIFMSRIVKNILKEYLKNLSFVNYAFGIEKELIIKNASLVITPSLIEGFGLSALEAMSLGKVVIATKNNGYNEFIVDGKNGILSKPGDANDLYIKICNIINSKNKLDIEINAKNVANSFLMEHLVIQTINLYKDTINEFKRNK